MSDLDHRVTALEDQVVGIRETLAIVQNEQKHSVKTLDRIEAQLTEMCKQSQTNWASALKNPQTLLLGLVILGGLLGHDTMQLATMALHPAAASPAALDIVP
tara:strand:- start:4296 stop:4601 length:306 start_codon:yes stop_codon:yes gene_type:complete